MPETYLSTSLVKSKSFEIDFSLKITEKEVQKACSEIDFSILEKFMFFQQKKGGLLPFFSHFNSDKKCFENITHFIYFLFNKNTLVYIGCTTNRFRLNGHSGKVYNNVGIIPIFNNKGFVYESLIINIFHTIYNKTVKNELNALVLNPIDNEIISATDVFYSVKKKFNLTQLEYCIIDAVYQLCQNSQTSKDGYCFMPNEYIAKAIGTSANKVIKTFNKAKIIGLIEVLKHEKGSVCHRKTTDTWTNSIVEAKNKTAIF